MKNYFKSFRVIVVTLTFLGFNYVNAQVSDDLATTSDSYSINVDQSSNSAQLLLFTQYNQHWKIHNSNSSLIFKFNDANLNPSITMRTDGTMLFSSTTRQMINLYNTEYGIGVQSNTQYFRTNQNFAWYRGGIHSHSELNNGGGTTLMTLEDNGDLTVSGNLGLGVNDPTEKLQVNGGSLYFNGESQGIIIDAAGYKRIGIMKYWGREAGIWRVANQDFEFGRVGSTNDIKNGSGATVDMAIEGNGDVFINSRLLVGDQTPIANTIAHFDGRVYISEEGGTEEGFSTASGFKYDDYLLWVEEGIVSLDLALTELNDWPDYVFEADYELASLEEVENHIKTNGHMHTMPSADEVQSQGLSVKDITQRTVRTVEEMTLHLIAQEKQIKSQNDLIDDLMKRLEKIENARY